MYIRYSQDGAAAIIQTGEKDILREKITHAGSEVQLIRDDGTCVVLKESKNKYEAGQVIGHICYALQSGMIYINIDVRHYNSTAETPGRETPF